MFTHLSHHEGETCVRSILDCKVELEIELARENRTSRRQTLLKELWKLNHTPSDAEDSPSEAALT